MNRGVDCKDTIYEITFPLESKSSLIKLSRVLKGLLPEDYVEVQQSGEVVSIIISIYEDLDK